MQTLLTIDDDRIVLKLVEKAFSDNDAIELITRSSAEEGLKLIVEGAVDVCLLDIMLPEMSGIDLAKKIRSIDARLPVIFITSLDDSETAIEAMKLGAYEFCNKPLDIANVQDLVERALEARRLMRSPVKFSGTNGFAGEDNGDQLVGKSSQMVDVYKQIGRVAGQNVPVLVRGESGTGKELIARAIYQHSNRSEECYLAVNCAAFSDTLLESELFGHEKGAFTGADRRHIGKFEQSHNGTIFLDEIGDMSQLLQSKVLRLLQDQVFERVGGSQTIETDARIISATNRQLEEMIEDGEFRLDLYHRINAIEIFIPPLRERGDDIYLLTEFFINRLAKSLRKNVTGISPEALEKIRQHNWPGNVRELQSTIRRAILMATGPVIVPENLSLERVSGGPAINEFTDGNLDDTVQLGIGHFGQLWIDGQSKDLYAETLKMMEVDLLTRVLRHTGGNQSKASEILGITRGSLRHKIQFNRIVIEELV